MSLIKSISIKQRYITTAHIPKIIIKKIYFLSWCSIRMSGNSINFNQKKMKISDFYKNKNKEIFNKDSIDVNKILASRKVHMAKIIHLNTLLDIMIMILLDHFL